MTHDDAVDNLPAMLRGELDRAVLADTVGHLHDCPRCQQDLVAMAAANGAVLAARRTLLVGHPAAGSGEVPLPADLPAYRPPRSRRTGRVLAPVLSGLAAACLAVLATVAVMRSATDQPAGPVQRAQLSAVAPGGPASGPPRSGSVTMRAAAQAGTVMTIQTSGLPSASSGRFYYAWLFNPETNKMLALGVVGPDGTATFKVDTTLLSRYQAVDVSLQDDNGNPAHSSVSVLRGQY